MKLIIGLVILLLVIVVASKYSTTYFTDRALPFPFSRAATATVNNQTFKLYLATSDKDRMTGLSERTSMPQDYGMLFEFEKPDYYSFWMKNMKFPIDIIFLKDNKIVTIYPNLQPPTASSEETLPILKPEEPANKVLEINAGLSQKYNLKKGDSIVIKK